MNAIRRRWLAVASIGVLAAVVSVLATIFFSGCMLPSKPKPELYAVRGRVVDAATMQGLGQARLMLRASLMLRTGPQTQRAVLANPGITEADGTYVLELLASYTVVSEAEKITLEIAKTGYTPATIEIPPPTRKEAFYKMPDTLMTRVPAIPWKSQ